MTAIFVPMEERVYQTPLDTSASVIEDLQAWSVKVSHITKYIIKHFSSTCFKSADVIVVF